MVDRDAPPIIWMCVGPQAVTSWPNSRCQMSSRGNPASATAPHTVSRIPPTGTDQFRVSRTALALRPSPRKRDNSPATAIPSSPAMMNQWAGLPNAPSSRPWSMWIETSQ